MGHVGNHARLLGGAFVVEKAVRSVLVGCFQVALPLLGAFFWFCFVLVARPLRGVLAGRLLAAFGCQVASRRVRSRPDGLACFQLNPHFLRMVTGKSGH